MLEFEDGELVDGKIKGWPVSFVADNYGPQGWSLNLAPYEGENGETSPDEIQEACWAANDSLAGLAKPSKKAVRAAIENSGFVKD